MIVFFLNIFLLLLNAIILMKLFIAWMYVLLQCHNWPNSARKLVTSSMSARACPVMQLWAGLSKVLLLRKVTFLWHFQVPLCEDYSYLASSTLTHLSTGLNAFLTCMVLHYLFKHCFTFFSSVFFLCPGHFILLRPVSEPVLIGSSSSLYWIFPLFCRLILSLSDLLL